MQLFTDASGAVGWDAFWNGRWLQACWSHPQSVMPIVWKELYVIVCAVHSWGISGLSRDSPYPTSPLTVQFFVPIQHDVCLIKQLKST